MSEILIVDHAHPALQETLLRAGLSCTTDLKLTYNAFLHCSDNYLGIVIRSKFVVDEAIIDSKPSLRFIVRLGSGVENIDTEYAQKKGIMVISTPEGNANAVAEHCLALLLCGLRHIAVANNEVCQGLWLREKNKGTELQSHTYGIIGYGHTGPAFAKILNSLGCTVFAFDSDKSVVGDENATMITIDHIYNICDVISLNVNYFPENHHFFNGDFINKMKKPFLLINTSRGAVVDTSAVVNGLQNGKILFAGLDVLEYENTRLQLPKRETWPEAMQKLSKMENVLLTPHIGGQTTEAELRHAIIAANRILEIMAPNTAHKW